MSHYDHVGAVGALALQTTLPVTKTPFSGKPRIVSPIKRVPSFPTSTTGLTLLPPATPPPSVPQDVMDALLVIGVAVPAGADPTSPATLLLMVHAFQRMAGMQEGPLDEGTTAAIKAALAKFAGDLKLPETEEEKRKKQQMLIAGVIAVGVVGFILMRRK
jgi:predicted Zn-dependent peptidase